MNDFWVSKNYKYSNFGPNPTLDNKIEIFRDRVTEWQIEIANELRPSDHAGFGIIAILFSYFEMIAQYKNGKSGPTSSGDFREGFRFVFKSTQLSDTELNSIYKKVRCGLYHNGYIRNGVLIHGQHPKTIEIDTNGTILINPHTLIDDIRTHFATYITNIKNLNNQPDRINFEAMFDTV